MKRLPEATKRCLARFSGVSAIIVMISVGYSDFVQADTASPWVEGLHTAARLIAGAKTPAEYGNRLVAGVHLKLEKGWKTYWRIPGDAGVPPQFDWSGSENVGELRVLWPAPKRLKDAYGTSIGYYDEVVFPVIIAPKEAGQSVSLKLKFGYAVCKDICIPIEAAIDLQIGGAKSLDPDTNALLTNYLAHVPVPVGKEKPGRLPHLRAVKATLDNVKPRLLIEAVYSKDAGGRDLFAEAPDGFYLPVPDSGSEKAGGIVQFQIDLSQGDDAKSLHGKIIRFTLVSDAGHSEVEWLIN